MPSTEVKAQKKTAHPIIIDKKVESIIEATVSSILTRRMQELELLATNIRVTRREVARLLQVSSEWVRRKAAAGDFKEYTYEDSLEVRYYLLTDIIAYMKGKE